MIVNSYKTAKIFYGILFLFLSCSTGIEHHYLIDFYQNGTYKVEFNAIGDYDDFLDNDATVPKGENWHVIHNLMYDDVENHEYQAEKLFQSNSYFPNTFYKGDSIHPIALLKHPGEIKYLNLFFLKLYKFKIIYEGRKLQTNYPLFAAELDSGWAYQSLSRLFNETLLRANLEFNLNAIVEADLKNWLITELSSKSDDDLFNNYIDYKNEGLNILMLPSPVNKHDEIESIFNALEHHLRISAELVNDSFTYSLIIPGKLDSTNANQVINDTLKWQFELNNYLEDDYTMYASSYIFSLPKFIILICGVFLLVVFGKKYFRRK